MKGNCCVFQPFDGGVYDQRYEETIAPAVRDADLEPYRVDRDLGAVIPVDALHEQIKLAATCLADITTRNPNVMYEVGYALASAQDVVLLCGLDSTSERLPFNIQHRGVIEYRTNAPSDFAKLKAEITSRLKALLQKQATVERIVSASPVSTTQGLQPWEIAALAFIMANRDSTESGVSPNTIKSDLDKAGYNSVAAGLALTSLERKKYIVSATDHDYHGEPFLVHKLTSSGENWLLDNQDKLELRTEQITVTRPRKLITEGDVPF
jgi:hypothetical protein